MKKGLVVFLMFFSVLLIIPKETIKEWQCYKPIKISGSSKYKYFFLDKEIYLYSNENLSDLRIIDKLGDTVPYYILEGFKIEEQKEVINTLKLIRNSKETDEKKAIVNTMFDYQLLSEKENLSCNKLELDVRSNEEYSNQIEIYGRNRMSDWSFITKDTIYNIDKFNKNEISLNNFFNYNFYRIKIIDDRDNLVLKECNAVFKKIDNKYDNYKEEISLKFDAKNKEDYTQITIENPNKLKLLKINIVAEGNFNRRYDLSLGESEYQSYSDNLYKFKHNDIDISKTTIDFEGSVLNEKVLILKIYNYDNAPLGIDEIKAEYIIDKVIFEDNDNKEYKVYFGNPEATKPSYDIESFQTYIEKDNKDKCVLGSLVKLKGKEKDQIKEESKINYKIIFNILVVIVSVVLVLSLMFILKKK